MDKWDTATGKKQALWTRTRWLQRDGDAYSRLRDVRFEAQTAAQGKQTGKAVGRHHHAWTVRS